MKFGTPVFVAWIDSAVPASGWIFHEDQPLAPVECITAGLLVGNDKHHVTVASSLTPEGEAYCPPSRSPGVPSPRYISWGPRRARRSGRQRRRTSRPSHYGSGRDLAPLDPAGREPDRYDPRKKRFRISGNP